MTSFRLNARRPIDPAADDGFEVSYVPDDGAVQRVPLARAWDMPLERSLPVRRFTSRKGQRHLSGSVVVSRHRRPRGVRVLVGTRSSPNFQSTILERCPSRACRESLAGYRSALAAVPGMPRLVIAVGRAPSWRAA